MPRPRNSRWRELRQLLNLSVSLSTVHVGFHLTGFVDTALAGRVDAETLAATGLGSAIFFVFSVFGVGTVMGLDPIVAQQVGAGRDAEARRAMWQGIWVGVLVSLPISMVVLSVGAHLTAFGIEPALAGRTHDYLLGRVPSMCPLFACVAMRAYLQARHQTRAVVIAVIGLNVVNFVADWVLIFGDAGLEQVGLPGFGIPALGVTGVAWASTLSMVGQMVVLGLAVRLLGDVVPGGWRPDTSGVRPILNVGTPLGLQLLAEVGLFAGVGVLMGGMGAEVMAAHQVALQIVSMTFAVALGIGSATSVQVGRAIGRGDARATRRAGLSGISVGAAFMAAMALLLWTMPESIARIMTSDAAVIPAAGRLLLIAAVFQVADGVQAVGAGALRGAGLTRWTFLANLVGHWCLGAPVGLLLAYVLNLGPAGLWWGLTTGLAAVALSLAAKFAHVSRRPIAQITAVEGESPSE